jgi:hypothetical protein
MGLMYELRIRKSEGRKHKETFIICLSVEMNQQINSN